MRILLIAPDSAGLDLSKEIAGVVNSHANQVHLLAGNVGETDIERECAEESYDVLWFAAHGGPEGILLSDGQVITAEALVPYVRQAGSTLVFINTCSSVELANDIAQQTNADVVCTIKSVPDKTAMRTGVFFANQLAKGMGYRQAYDNSKPGGNRVYLYITNSTYTRQREKPMADISEYGQSTSNGKQLDRLTVAMEDLRKQVGDMAVRLAVMETRLNDIDKKLSLAQNEHIPWQQWAILLGVGMMVALAIILSRVMLGA